LPPCTTGGCSHYERRADRPGSPHLQLEQSSSRSCTGRQASHWQGSSVPGQAAFLVVCWKLRDEERHSDLRPGGPGSHEALRLLWAPSRCAEASYIEPAMEAGCASRFLAVHERLPSSLMRALRHSWKEQMNNPMIGDAWLSSWQGNAAQQGDPKPPLGGPHLCTPETGARTAAPSQRCSPHADKIHHLC